MLYQRGYQTYVEIKGEDGDFQIAQPYRMRVRRNNRIRCYIESRPGAEYRVVSYDTYSNHGTGGILTIDGEQTESLVFRKITAEESEHSSLNSSLNPEVRALATFSGKLGGPETQYPYMFRAEVGRCDPSGILLRLATKILSRRYSRLLSPHRFLRPSKKRTMTATQVLYRPA